MGRNRNAIRRTGPAVALRRSAAIDFAVMACFTRRPEISKNEWRGRCRWIRRDSPWFLAQSSLFS